MADLWFPDIGWENLARDELAARRSRDRMMTARANPALAARVANLSAMYPQSSGGILTAAALAGMEPDDPQMMELARIEMEHNVIQNPSHTGPFGFISDALAWGGDRFRSLTRAVFGAFDLAYREGIIGTTSFVTGLAQGLSPGESARRSYGFSAPAVALAAALQGQEVNTGTGYFIGGNLSPETEAALEAGQPIGQAMQNAAQQALGIPAYQYGEGLRQSQGVKLAGTDLPVTPGRIFATTMVEPGTRPFNLISGATDFASNVALDPSNILLAGLGALRNSARVLAVGGVRPTVLARNFDTWAASRHGQGVFAALAENRRYDQIYDIVKGSTGNRRPDAALVASLTDASTPTEVADLIAAAVHEHKISNVLMPQGLIAQRLNLPGASLTEAALGSVLPKALGGRTPLTNAAGLRLSARVNRQGGFLARMAAEIGAQSVDVNDLDQSVQAFGEWMKLERFAPDRRGHYMARMARESSVGEGPYDAALRVMNDAAAEQGARYRAVGYSDAVSRFQTRFFNETAEMRKYWTNRLGDAQYHPGAPTVMLDADGETWLDLPSPHMLSEYLDRNIPLPDARATRHATRRLALAERVGITLPVQDPAHFHPNVLVQMMDSFQGKVWKPVLLLRPAYILRVGSELQARMGSSELSSMFKHPFDYIMWVLKRKGGFDPEGNPTQIAAEYVAAMSRGGRNALREQGGRRQIFTSEWIRQVKDRDPRWIDGATIELQKLWNDRLAIELAGLGGPSPINGIGPRPFFPGHPVMWHGKHGEPLPYQLEPLGAERGGAGNLIGPGLYMSANPEITGGTGATHSGLMGEGGYAGGEFGTNNNPEWIGPNEPRVLDMMVPQREVYDEMRRITHNLLENHPFRNEILGPTGMPTRDPDMPSWELNGNRIYMDEIRGTSMEEGPAGIDPSISANQRWLVELDDGTELEIGKRQWEQLRRDISERDFPDMEDVEEWEPRTYQDRDQASFDPDDPDQGFNQEHADAVNELREFWRIWIDQLDSFQENSVVMYGSFKAILHNLKEAMEGSAGVYGSSAGNDMWANAQYALNRKLAENYDVMKHDGGMGRGPDAVHQVYVAINPQHMVSRSLRPRRTRKPDLSEYGVHNANDIADAAFEFETPEELHAYLFDPEAGIYPQQRALEEAEEANQAFEANVDHPLHKEYYAFQRLFQSLGEPPMSDTAAWIAHAVTQPATSQTAGWAPEQTARVWELLRGGRAAAPPPPEVMENVGTFGAWYQALEDRVVAVQKVGSSVDWTHAEHQAWSRGDWRTFTRLRGYTDEEIADFGQLLALQRTAGRSLDATDVMGLTMERRIHNAAGPEDVYEAVTRSTPQYFDEIRPQSFDLNALATRFWDGDLSGIRRHLMKERAELHSPEGARWYIESLWARLHQATGGSFVYRHPGTGEWFNDARQPLTAEQIANTPEIAAYGMGPHAVVPLGGFVITKPGNADLLSAISTQTLGDLNLNSLHPSNSKRFKEVMAYLDANYRDSLPAVTSVAREADPSMSKTLDRMTDWLFQMITSGPEDFLARGPAYDQFLWSKIGQLLPSMTPPVRRQVLERAREAGINRRGLMGVIGRMRDPGDADTTRALHDLANDYGSLADRWSSPLDVIPDDIWQMEDPDQLMHYMFGGYLDPASPASNATYPYGNDGLWRRANGLERQIRGDVTPEDTERILRADYGPGGLPPVPEGHVRLYRGDTRPGDTGYSAVPDWVQETEAFRETMAASGRWFTNSPNEALWYAREGTGKVSYVDLPEAEAEAMLAVKDPKASAFMASTISRPMLEKTEYFVSRAVANRAIIVGHMTDPAEIAEAQKVIDQTNAILRAMYPGRDLPAADVGINYPTQSSLLSRPTATVSHPNATITNEAALAAIHNTAPISSVEDATFIAKAYASEETKRLLYDSSKRHNMADIARFLAPFGEAWFEILSSWGKIMTKNPGVIRRGQQLIQGARQSGFFYTDPDTGDEVFNYPGGGMMADWMFKEPDDPNAPYARPTFTGRVSGLNLIGQFIPGFGPVVQIPAGRFTPLTQDPAWRDLRDLVFPFGQPEQEGTPGDFVNSTIVPNWLKKGLIYLLGDEGTTGDNDRLLNNTIIDVYRSMLQNGMVQPGPEGNAIALSQAEKYAKQIYGFRSLTQFMGPTGAGVRWDIEWDDPELDPDGRIASFGMLADEWRIMREANAGDDVATFDQFVAQFGLDPLAIVTPKTQVIRPRALTEEGLDFQNANPDLFENYKLTAYYASPDPADGEFDYGAYLAQLRAGDREALTPEQWLAQRNRLVGEIAYEAQRQRLVRPYDGQVRTDPAATAFLRMLKKDLMAQYPGFGFDTPGVSASATSEQMRIEFERWRTDPALMETDAGRGLGIYLEARDQALRVSAQMGFPGNGRTLSTAEGAAPIRAWLASMAQWIAMNTMPDDSPNADFVALWERAYASETETEGTEQVNLLGEQFAVGR